MQDQQLTPLRIGGLCRILEHDPRQDYIFTSFYENASGTLVLQVRPDNGPHMDPGPVLLLRVEPAISDWGGDMANILWRGRSLWIEPDLLEML